MVVPAARNAAGQKIPTSPRKLFCKEPSGKSANRLHAIFHPGAAFHLRLCRSIQVEGAFALLKNDFGFARFLTRGKRNIRTELFFLVLAFDLKKLWMKREHNRLKTRESGKMVS